VQVKDATTCKEYYGKNGCDKVKATADCFWACAHAGMTAQTTYGCGAATVYATNNGVQLPKCLSMTDMFTAICDETAAEITTLVANGKTEGKCSDTGAAFSHPAKATTPVEAMPKPASARRWCSRHLSSRMPSWRNKLATQSQLINNTLATH
jgi:hypothetical protein